jgi:phosphate starvation-inducible protein PhoH and related proteins
MSNRDRNFERRQPPQGADYPIQEIKLDAPSDQKLATILFSQNRGHLHQYLAQRFDVFFDTQIDPNANTLKFSGTPEAGSRVKRAFAMLSGMVNSGTFIDKNVIRKVAAEVNPPAGMTAAFKAANQNAPGQPKATGGAFQAKTEAQAKLAELIDNNELVFAVGPAGTGKTHVAVVKAITALKEGKIKKILLARPAAEAGEKIGYLPGDANAKLAPYMRPIYDELDKAFGNGKYKNMMDNGTIEIVPLGYMRGRTFEDAFIIVDEAQNTTIDQMKMALTRIGNNSRMVVTGDPTQIDLEHKESGLMFAVARLKGKDGVGVQEFEGADVMRSKIVMTVVEAFEDAPVQGRAPAPKPISKDDALDAALSEKPAPATPSAPKPQGNQGSSNPRW